MGRCCKILVMVLAVVFISAILVQGASLDSYWQRMSEGSSTPALVYSWMYEYKAEELEITASIPQLANTKDLVWQERFNQSLRDYLSVFVDELKETVAKVKGELNYSFSHHPYQGILDYDVQLNKGGLLSIALTSYVYTGGAHGMTYQNYLNLDLDSAREITFRDIFNTEEELQRATSIINAEIVSKPDQFFIDAFTIDQFQAEQGFYLLDNEVVICFGLYELAPYVFGIQEFKISAP